VSTAIGVSIRPAGQLAPVGASDRDLLREAIIAALVAL
jgi:hypothetical protein